MPRRKQDKPQHLEEDMKMEQLTGSATWIGSSLTDRGGDKTNLEGELPHPVNPTDGVNSTDCSPDKATVATDREMNECSDSEDVVEENAEPEEAAIAKEDWLNLKATVTSIQQQMQFFGLQQFQIMQLLASQNPNSAHSSTCESVPLTSENNQSQVEKSVSSSSSEAERDEPEVKEELKIGTDQIPDDEEVKSCNMVNGDISEYTNELSPPLTNSWTENDEQGEPASFDCTHCSAVLPSPELLKIHMFTHQRRAAAASEKASDLMPYTSIGSQLEGSSCFSSLPPSYQSIINDLSNDSLEEYMEIQKPENTHLEQLVKNMDGTVTDPNQCLMCKRILSCKSALMMHYRTHTGERPFKCKLCSRAFTTKGNLKTHMGVHRAKPPLRLLHSCMVCNKQFTNALVLNQHMKMHSDEAARKRSFDVQNSINSEECKRQRLSLNSESSFKDEPVNGYATSEFAKKMTPPDFHQLPSAGVPPRGFPFDFGIPPSIQDHLRYAEVFARQWEQFSQYPMFNPMVSVKPPMFPPPMGLHTPNGMGLPPFSMGTSSGLNNTKVSLVNNLRAESMDQVKERPTDVDGDDISSLVSQNDKSNQDANRQSNMSPKSERSWDSNDTTSNSVGMKLDPPPGTACDICMKTFACRSALEIHYRSHTKHRPFKCDLCDKAFTTRGNMKQHILTHKTEDIQWNSGENSSVLSVPSPPSTDVAPLSDDLKKSGGGRHQCTVCLKHFSSASAVQIHFRTHTGDRPFKCTVCGKAFTTKGNLKVHMGTHMWSGSPTFRLNKSMSNEVSEGNSEGAEEETTPGTSPSRLNVLTNNNNMNSFNPNPLIKAPFMGNPAALMANYSGLFLPPAAPIQQPTYRPNKLLSNEVSEGNSEGAEEETTPVISPSRLNALANNNNMNLFNPNPLIKAPFMGNPAALMANYSGLFLPPLAPMHQPPEETNRPFFWQVTCHICSKECKSPIALELHLKTHIVNESGSSKPVTAS